FKVYSSELGFGEIGTNNVGDLQIGAAKVSSGEIGVLHVGAAKIAVFQIGPVEVDPFEIAAGEGRLAPEIRDRLPDYRVIFGSRTTNAGDLAARIHRHGAAYAAIETAEFDHTAFRSPRER